MNFYSFLRGELGDGEDGTKEEVLSKPSLKGFLQRNRTGTHSIPLACLLFTSQTCAPFQGSAQINSFRLLLFTELLDNINYSLFLIPKVY